MNKRRWYARLTLQLTIAFLLFFAALAGCQLRGASEEQAVPAQSPIAALDPAVAQRAMAIQDRNTDGLLAIAGVIGTATGFDRSGAPLLLVLAGEKAVALIPRSVEGLPVVIKSVDGVFAMDDTGALPTPTSAHCGVRGRTRAHGPL